MHPNAFLHTFWRKQVNNQVFVAISFDEDSNKRYEDIIRPSIEDESFNGVSLKAYRVDNSKTGDSILTDIIDKIAHSLLILADVSVIDKGKLTDKPFRNGNVMYEVKIALACRPPSEVLLIREDNEKLLFDVSTIPHLQINFNNREIAIRYLREAISDRIRERSLINDIRVQINALQLTDDDVRLLKIMGELKKGCAFDPRIEPVEGTKILSAPDARGIQTLIEKQLIQNIGILDDGAI